jgi:hypothetical protein
MNFTHSSASIEVPRMRVNRRLIMAKNESASATFRLSTASFAGARPATIKIYSGIAKSKVAEVIRSPESHGIGQAHACQRNTAPSSDCHRRFRSKAAFGQSLVLMRFD